MSLHDPKFKYRGAATHADGGIAFAKRMQARRRIVEAQARRDQAADAAKVRPIRRKAGAA